MRVVLCILLLFSARSNAQVYILGIAQDGGYPHAGCVKQCCAPAWKHEEKRRFVTSLAVVCGNQWWLVEATPDIRDQLQYFRELTGGKYSYLPAGMFITHAHIGHYAGLMQLGREVLNTQGVPVYVLPRMKHYLETNGPWSQLVSLGNIKLMTLETGATPTNSETGHGLELASGLCIEAFTVPHRDEYSETAGFRILLAGKKYLFIPDIDKWAKWETDIRDAVASVDIALLDGTFFRDGELPGRNMTEVPHPFVAESMSLLGGSDLKKRVWFIHFNHTNPLLWNKTSVGEVEKQGFHIARQGDTL